MGKIGNLFGLYAKNPSRFFQHAGNGLKSLLAEGPASFAKKVAIVFDIARDAREEERAVVAIRIRSQQLLAQYQASHERLFERVLERLRDFIPDATELDEIPDRSQRMAAFSRQMLTGYDLFDEMYYRSKYLTGRKVRDALDHYISEGQYNGLWPNPYFDPVDYLLTYPEVARSGIDPVIHFTFFAKDLGYVAGQLFDPAYYLRMNEDVAKTGLPPFAHYLKTGRLEGRRPFPFSGPLELKELAQKWGRGTILIVSHDAEIGGAQTIALNLARWLNAGTLFSVKILLMRGGPNRQTFARTAPIFDFEGHERLYGFEQAVSMMKEWSGSDVQCVLLNSVASGRFFDIWDGRTPVVSYVHELPRIIAHYGDYAEKILRNSVHVVSGSMAVQASLLKTYTCQPPRHSIVYDHVDSFEHKPELTLEDKRQARLALDPEFTGDAILVVACGTAHWRKRPDLFIDVAIAALAEEPDRFDFIWIGDGEDYAACVARVEALGLSGKIRFVGQQTDLDGYFRACDVFLLPSEEDPFPIVALSAALACAPTICFNDAGGIPEFVEESCGTAVPFLDTQAMLKALKAYADNPGLRLTHGQNARLKAMRNFTLLTTGPQLLEILRTEAGLKPIVSVVVPNYNYETFLTERLASIQQQTFQDFEVILLDDCSSDSSIEIMREFAQLRPGTRLITNDKNSGSPFRQWLRGIREARADLIWLAEADDRAEPLLLEALLPAFEDRNVLLAYGKSVPIDADGMVLGDYEDIYLDRIQPGRWSKPYVCTDHEEMSNGLGIGNCIPNASSVIVRKFDPDPEFESTLTSMRLCGDWYFYCQAIRGGRIFYSSRPVNLHRRHATTVTSGIEGSDRYFEELQTVRTYIGRNYRLTDRAKDQITRFVTEDLDRFGLEDDMRRADILHRAVGGSELREIPSLAVIMPDLSPGGGQVFSISLANAWARLGGRVALFNVGQLPDHPEMKSRIHPRVSYYDCRALPKPFASLLRELDVDVIQSSIWWADRFVLDSLSEFETKPVWVSTMHGCAESILDNPEIDPGFESRFERLLTAADAVVITAAKNRKVFGKTGEPPRLLRIDNGISPAPVGSMSRKQLGIRENALLLCLAARAIPEKGWREAAELVELLNRFGIVSDLLLIGDGKLADEMRGLNRPNIHLTGQVSDLQNYIALSDICLLPSYFVGESFPLVVLEYLSLGKPVIATDVGEIPYILGDGDEDAVGIIVPLKAGRPDLNGLYNAVVRLSDPSVRLVFSERARRRFEGQFTLDHMISRYMTLYKDLISETEKPVFSEGNETKRG